MKSAAKISEKGMKTAMEVIKPGSKTVRCSRGNSKDFILWYRRIWRRIF